MNSLRKSLLAAMDPAQIFHSTTWGNPRPMTEAYRDVKRAFAGSEPDRPTEDVLQTLLRKFAQKKQVSNFVELKSVCYGITVPVSENHWRLIDQAPLVDSLLKQVEQFSAQPKQYRRCYQGLLHGYFGFDRQLVTPDAGHDNWNRLRCFLSDNLQPVIQASGSRGLSLEWLQSLSEHRNLLSVDPCSRYARALQNGLSDELKVLCTALGISSTSWVWDEALMAYVRAVCEGSDPQFKRGMSGVLDLVAGRSELKLAQMLSIRATGLTVSRYSKCVEQPENIDLRDTSVRLIGNPQNATAWQAHVNYEPARQMVLRWHGRRLMRDFFEHLTHDGNGDERRLKYWLKWEPQITGMWFVLGDTALQNRTAEFRDLRKRMEGYDRALVDNNPENNAFIMRIGPLLVIEFGEPNNACFVFAAADFKASLDRKRLSTLGDLKQKIGAKRLVHRQSWEERFDYDLKNLLQTVPHSRGQLRASTQAISAPAPAQQKILEARRPPLEEFPRAISQASTNTLSTGATAGDRTQELDPALSAMPRPATRAGFWAADSQSLSFSRKIISEANFYLVRERCIQHRVKCEDNRSRGGALWVLMPDRSSHLGFAAFLEGLGFQHTPGKGFWIKAEGGD